MGDLKTIEFVTLGMFIIDDIYPSPAEEDQSPRLNVIGGAGTYSALGARLLSPPPLSSRVGWIVDAGTDFPESIQTTLTSWSTSLLLRPRAALTTRGWNGYGDNDYRAFKYLTEKKRLTASDLTPQLLASRSFHFICGATRCIEMVKQIHMQQADLVGTSIVKSLFIWEPVPDYCIPSELDATIEAMRYVDVISPNHDELASLFGDKHATTIDKQMVERHAKTLSQRARESTATSEQVVVVRASKLGCCIVTSDGVHWLPAYHQDGTKVVDPTGGGNGFLGGFAIGMVRNDNDPVEAARWGSVAASFCIEQVGVSELASNDTAGETWNGQNVYERLEEFRIRS